MLPFSSDQPLRCRANWPEPDVPAKPLSREFSVTAHEITVIDDGIECEVLGLYGDKVMARIVGTDEVFELTGVAYRSLK